MGLKFDRWDPEWSHPMRRAELSTGWGERFRRELLKRDTEPLAVRRETVNEYMGWICRFGSIQAGQVCPSTCKRGITERFVTINSLAVSSLFDVTSPVYKGPDGMSRTLKGLNCDGELLLRPEYIFLPIQQRGIHWILGVIIPGQRMVAVLDSIPGNENMEVAVVIDNMIRHELGSRYDHRDNGELYEDPNWVLYDRTQNDGSGCGVHMLTAAMCMIMGWRTAYEANDAPGNSIAPGLSNPKYPLSHSDSTTDSEIAGQNQRTEEGASRESDKKSVLQGWVTNPPNLLCPRMLPTPYKSREGFVAAVDSCNYKRALSMICRAHGWDIREYYAWGDAGVSLKDYKAKVKEEDAKIRSGSPLGI